jgi:NADH-quinone oxidoreductase subunit G
MVRKKKMIVGRVGEIDDQTYKITELGNDLSILEEILSGKHAFCKELKKSKNSMIILGDAAYSRNDGLDITKLADQIAKLYKGKLNILHNHASNVGALDIGFTNHKMPALEMVKKLKCLYLLGADEIEIPDSKDIFIISGSPW